MSNFSLAVLSIAGLLSLPAPAAPLWPMQFDEIGVEIRVREIRAIVHPAAAGDYKNAVEDWPLAGAMSRHFEELIERSFRDAFVDDSFDFGWWPPSRSTVVRIEVAQRGIERPISRGVEAATREIRAEIWFLNLPAGELVGPVPATLKATRENKTYEWTSVAVTHLNGIPLVNQRESDAARLLTEVRLARASCQAELQDLLEFAP